MKKSNFANIVRLGDEALIHNSLFGGAVKAKCDASKLFLRTIETDSRFELDENEEFHKVMKDMRMIVNDETDESSLVNFHFLERQQKDLYIILIVTRQCNFRCTYCYEDFRNEVMDSSVYENVLKVIEDLIDAKGYKSLQVSFFGGEPMLEYEAICQFMEKTNELAKKKSIYFFGEMTTNAYLLISEKFEKLVSIGLTNYQITVDGLRDTHDKGRPLANGGGSWEKIIQNLY